MNNIISNLCGKVDLLGILFISLYIQLQLHTNYIKYTSQHEPAAASACKRTPPSPHAPVSLSFPSSSVSSLVFTHSHVLDHYLSERNLLSVSTMILLNLSNRVNVKNPPKQTKKQQKKKHISIANSLNRVTLDSLPTADTC